MVKCKVHLDRIPMTGSYSKLLSSVSDLLEQTRRTSARTVNGILTATYWEVGRRIIEFEQQGEKRALYGEALLNRLSIDLTSRFGKGFSRQNIQSMRLFYGAFGPEKICQTLSGKLQIAENSRTPSDASNRIKNSQILTGNVTLSQLTAAFPLPWSHYVRLLTVENTNARTFYEAEAIRGGWSVRQLDRQISTQFYERTALSKNKEWMLKNGCRPLKHETLTAEEEIKDPYILEFLGLKDEYSESDLEQALIQHLERFLLELGGDFAFIGRQKRLRVGSEWYRIDLLFFHRVLRCLVVIDLKVGRFTHADAGQMHLYLNYARENWVRESENPPVGLILCAEKDTAVAKYALEGLPNKILASEYKLALPDEKKLVKEVQETRKHLLDRR